MPARAASAPCPFCPKEVRRTSFTAESLGFALMARPRESPSMSGILKSRTARSKGEPLTAAASRARRARGPSSTVDTRRPQWESCCRRIWRFVALSSTTRTRRPARRVAVPGAVTASPGWRSKRAVNQKVLPLPAWLSTAMDPPMSPTSRLEIASPSPVPP